MLKKIIFIGLSVVLFNAGLKAQEKIALTVNGTASNNAKNLAKTTIVDAVKKSNDFVIANAGDNITIVATVNKGEGNFEFQLKATNKAKNFEKTYEDATESGYAGFPEKITALVHQILAELPRTVQVTTQPQQSHTGQPNVVEQPQTETPLPNDNNLGVTHVIRDDRYTQPEYEEETTVRTGFELGAETCLGSDFLVDATIAYRFVPKMAVGLGLGISQFAFFDVNLNDTKWSPFIRAELGLMPYTYEYGGYYDYYYGYYHEGYSYSGSSLYFGATGGVRYSFNHQWALQAGVKTCYTVEVGVLSIGLNVGAVFHF